MLSTEEEVRTLRVHAQAKGHCMDKSQCMTELPGTRGCHLPPLSLCKPHLSTVLHETLEY